MQQNASKRHFNSLAFIRLCFPFVTFSTTSDEVDDEFPWHSFTLLIGYLNKIAICHDEVLDITINHASPEGFDLDVTCPCESAEFQARNFIKTFFDIEDQTDTALRNLFEGFNNKEKEALTENLDRLDLILENPEQFDFVRSLVPQHHQPEDIERSPKLVRRTESFEINISLRTRNTSDEA